MSNNFNDLRKLYDYLFGSEPLDSDLAEIYDNNVEKLYETDEQTDNENWDKARDVMFTAWEKRNK